MTIREHLHQKLRHAKNVKLAGFVVFGVGLALAASTGGRNPVIAGLAVAGFVVAFVAGIFIQARVCCPKCGKGVSKFLVRDENILLVWRPIDYCPYCGVSLDSEFTAPDLSAE